MVDWDFSGQARRIDLHLRAKYPLLKTRLFKSENYRFIIFISNPEIDIVSLQQEFDHSIRFATAPVSLVNKIPEKYNEELEVISDDNIPCAFEGVPLSVGDFINFIRCKYPTIIVSNLEEDHDKHTITVYLFGNVDESIKNSIQKTLNEFKCSYKCLVKDGSDKKPALNKPANKDAEEVFFIQASSLSRLGQDLPFLKRDETLWFDNLEKIYKGEFTKDDLFFFNPAEASCFVNFSVFKNINLRNHLLLYDIVYCTLPLGVNDNFFEEQKITRKEFVDLVHNGRVKILNIQPETRLDYKLLKELNEANPSAIISRRALAALCAIDIVSINKDYIFNDPDFSSMLVPLTAAISEKIGINQKELINSIMWPRMALRKSFECLNDASTKRISNYGVNKHVYSYLPKELQRQEYEFEFTVNAEAIHIAHALDATYFPFMEDKTGYSDKPYAQMMGNALNFYKCAKKDTLKNYFKIQDKKKAGIPQIDLISIFEINDYIPIEEFEKEVSKKFLRKGARSLFQELSSISTSECKSKIAAYNKKIESLIDKKKNENLFIDVGTDTAGLFIPFLTTAKDVITISEKKAQEKIPFVKKFFDKLGEFFYSNDSEKKAISLLTKINRVARLKKDYKQ